MKRALKRGDIVTVSDRKRVGFSMILFCKICFGFRSELVKSKKSNSYTNVNRKTSLTVTVFSLSYDLQNHVCRGSSARGEAGAETIVGRGRK